MTVTPGPLMIDGGTVDTVEFQGRKLVVLSNERVDTGAGILNGPIMPLPTLLLDLFGTPAVFTLNTPDKYDPETGECTCTHREIRTNGHPELHHGRRRQHRPRGCGDSSSMCRAKPAMRPWRC